MIVDIELDPPTTVKFDFCVFGSGPAGITVARILANAGKTVGLFEAGGLDYEDESQTIYEGESIGREYPISSCRLRYFGGTSNHWAGRCGLFDDVDFLDREGFWGLPGWPIERSELFQYLEEAKSILDLDQVNFEQRNDISERLKVFRRSIFAHSPPTRFGEKYLSEITKSKLITLHLNANLIDFDVDKSNNTVKHAEIKNYKGTSFEIQANDYVLCLGALENARFLLNCNLDAENPLGDQGAYLGRCFMEHLNLQLGRFLVVDADFWKEGSLQLSPSDQLILDNRMGNGVLAFDPSYTTKSYGRLRVIKEALRDLACQYDVSRGLARSNLDINCDGDGVITALFEQTPNPKSRVTLGSELDTFGKRRLRLDWQLSPEDHHSLRTASLEVAKSMAKQNVARVQVPHYVLDKSMDLPVHHHCHHMGTTRMSADPRLGVVDSNCKIHNSPNLYVGGSSVFPTGGGVNPTLTIVLLALRLGNFLIRKQ